MTTRKVTEIDLFLKCNQSYLIIHRGYRGSCGSRKIIRRRKDGGGGEDEEEEREKNMDSTVRISLRKTIISAARVQVCVFM